MNSLTHLPALRLLIPLICGIIPGLLIPVLPVWLVPSMLVVCSLMTLSFLFRSTDRPQRWQQFQGMLLFLLLICVGWYFAYLRVPAHQADHYSNWYQEGDHITIRILDPPVKKAKTWQCRVEMTQLERDGMQVTVSGILLAYIVTDEEPVPGQIYSSDRPLSMPTGAVNPGGFDYQKYLHNQGIYHTVYLPKEAYQLDGSRPLYVGRRWVLATSKWASSVLQDNIKDNQHKAILLALLLGERSMLDADIRQDFSQTGTMHILAVSGLHVGIIFMILDVLLSHLPLVRRKDLLKGYLKPVLILLFIWFYACITGLSPSIFRSAVMFSFLALGKPAGRYIHSLNIVAASAIALILINPLMVLQVGFQLSFLAVLGIILFQPFLSRIWLPTSKTGKYIWSILTVSLAAQIGTAPISIYYFHSFPNYFLLSNCLAIPLAFVILSAGLALLCCYWIPLIGGALAWILDASMHLLQWTLSNIGDLPGATISPLHIGLSAVIGAYLSLLFLYLFLSEKKKVYVFLFLVTSISNQLIISMQAYTDRTDSRLIAYSLNDGLAVAYTDGRSPHIWAYAMDSQAYDLHLYPSLNKIWISDISIYNIPTKGGCLQIGDVHMLFIMKPENAHSSCQPDVIIIDGDKVQSTELSVLDVQDADVLVSNTQQFRQRKDWNNWMSHQACTCQLLDGKEKWVEYNL